MAKIDSTPRSDIENRGGSAKATEIFAQFKSIESAADWLRGIVEEWADKDGRVESVAHAGRAWSNLGSDPDPVVSNLFDVITHQLESTYHLNNVLAGIARMQELAKAAEAAHG